MERFIEVLKLVSGANQPLALISNDKTALEGALKILAGKNRSSRGRFPKA